MVYAKRKFYCSQCKAVIEKDNRHRIEEKENVANNVSANVVESGSKNKHTDDYVSYKKWQKTQAIVDLIKNNDDEIKKALNENAPQQQPADPLDKVIDLMSLYKQYSAPTTHNADKSESDKIEINKLLSD